MPLASPAQALHKGPAGHVTRWQSVQHGIRVLGALKAQHPSEQVGDAEDNESAGDKDHDHSSTSSRSELDESVEYSVDGTEQSSSEFECSDESDEEGDGNTSDGVNTAVRTLLVGAAAVLQKQKSLTEAAEDSTGAGSVESAAAAAAGEVPTRQRADSAGSECSFGSISDLLAEADTGTDDDAQHKDARSVQDGGAALSGRTDRTDVVSAPVMTPSAPFQAPPALPSAVVNPGDEQQRSEADFDSLSSMGDISDDA